MKAEFNNVGVLKITPENLDEDEQLTNWYRANKNNVVGDYILFGCFNP